MKIKIKTYRADIKFYCKQSDSIETRSDYFGAKKLTAAYRKEFEQHGDRILDIEFTPLVSVYKISEEDIIAHGILIDTY